MIRMSRNCGPRLISMLSILTFTGCHSVGQVQPLTQSNPAGLTHAALDHELVEITIPKLEALYAARTFTVTQVTHWYLDRIARYDGVYKAVVHVDEAGALATAAAEDLAARNGGQSFIRGPLWGVPIVIKANTSVKGLVTNTGWKGYLIPGHELVAPMDATIVSKLRLAGAVILGQTNMPDFAASDTTISTAGGRTGNAYNWRFSPGGSSGGTVTSVAANFCVFGTGTDTGNSIRMPSGTSAVVGMLPTRGLVSTAGIHPQDWLLDNTGPIARTVSDAAIALGVMAGEDPKDFRTIGSALKAQRGPFTDYLKADALKGRCLGVPAFIVNPPPVGEPPGNSLRPETREMFMKAIDGLRAAGATVVFDDSLLPDSFLPLIHAVKTKQFRLEGTDGFFRDYGSAEYHSAAEYRRVTGSALPAPLTGTVPQLDLTSRTASNESAAETAFWAPQRRALAAYEEAFDRLHLDGLVYPALQMPSNDETIPGEISQGPHSATGWVNRIGVPAIVVPGGFYANGLPFGIELAARRWQDGDLIGWAFAYEQITKHRKPPGLVDHR
jgi:amidase